MLALLMHLLLHSPHQQRVEQQVLLLLLMQRRALWLLLLLPLCSAHCQVASLQVLLRYCEVLSSLLLLHPCWACSYGSCWGSGAASGELLRATRR